MKKLVSLFIVLQFLLLTPAMAQEDDFVKNTQTDILIVAGAAGAGAILGLSTLSFVEQPSRHLRNVWSGAAIGMIVGVIFVAYNSAQRGQEELQSSLEFNTHERVAWHQNNSDFLTFPRAQLSTQFWWMSF